MKQIEKRLLSSAQAAAIESSKAYTKFLSPWIILLAVLGLGFLAYANSFHSAFQFDDYSSILNAQSTKEYSSLSLLWSEEKRRFFAYLTFAVNYRWGGLDPFGYHVVNWIIHLLSTLSVFYLLRWLFGQGRQETFPARGLMNWMALGGALFFLLHPLQTMAVTYIVQRIASLAALSYVCALLFYCLGRGGIWGRWRCYTLSLLFMLIAFLTKQNTFSLPLAIVASELCFFPKRDVQPDSARRLFFALSFLLAGGVYWLCYHRTDVGSLGGALPGDGELFVTPWQYFLTQLTVIPHYLRLSILPFGQNVDYDWPLAQSLFEVRPLAGAGVLSAFLAAGFICFFRGARAAAFCIFWFFITLSVESSFIPIADVIFEHRMYLPMVGIAGIFAILLRRVVQRFGQPMMFLAVIAVVLTVLTYRRNEVWKTEYSFEQDIIKKSPKKARAYVNLAKAYSNDGNQEKALELIQKAIALTPKNTPTLIFMNRGTIYQEQEMWREALNDYLKVVELDPGKGVPLREAGYCYFKLNDLPKAEEFLRKAVELSPEDPSASFRLADVYWGQGKQDKARPFLIRTLDLIMDEERDQGKIIHVGEYKIAAIRLGGLYMQKRLFEKSLKCFDMVIALDPGVALAYQGRAINYAEMGQWDRVMEQIEALRKLKADKVLEALKATLQSIRARSVTPLPEGAVSK